MSEWTQISPDPAEPEAGHVGGAGCWAGLCVEVSLGLLGPCTGRGAPDALDASTFSVAPLRLQLRVPGAFPLTLGEGGCFLRHDFHVVTFQSCTSAPACGDASLCCLSVGLEHWSPWSIAFTCGLHCPPHDPAPHLHHVVGRPQGGWWPPGSDPTVAFGPGRTWASFVKVEQGEELNGQSGLQSGLLPGP